MWPCVLVWGMQHKRVEPNAAGAIAHLFICSFWPFHLHKAEQIWLLTMNCQIWLNVSAEHSFLNTCEHLTEWVMVVWMNCAYQVMKSTCFPQVQDLFFHCQELQFENDYSFSFLLKDLELLLHTSLIYPPQRFLLQVPVLWKKADQSTGLSLIELNLPGLWGSFPWKWKSCQSWAGSWVWRELQAIVVQIILLPCWKVAAGIQAIQCLCLLLETQPQLPAGMW